MANLAYQLVRGVYRTIVPEWLRTMRAESWRTRVTKATEKVQIITGGRVKGGPFAGMRYIERAFTSQLGPKLLGTYELELAPLLKELVAPPAAYLIDVGSAEGYYAVGLQLLRPDLRVTAFELDERASAALSELASLNGVSERLEVLGTATPEALQAVLTRTAALGGAAVLMDVDGAESYLLDPDVVPALTSARILVEIHPHLIPDIRDILEQRFHASHSVTWIPARPRTRKTIPEIPGLDQPDLMAAMWEARPDHQGWLWMQPRS